MGDFGLRAAFRFPACLLASVLELACGSATAAEIRATPLSGVPDTAAVLLIGTIEMSDGEKFRAATASYPKAIVGLASEGGSVIAAMDIGEQIRMHNYATVVPDRILCASACAIAWLGGTQRFMGTGAKIGFHAAYISQGGEAKESGVGNALLGRYLTTLGLPRRAIVFITEAPPEGMAWLTMADAERQGIDVSPFTFKGESQSLSPPVTAGVAPPPRSPQPAPPGTPPMRYAVDGLSLGERLRFDSEAYQKYRCDPSQKFPGFVWCHRKQQESLKDREILTSNSILHDPAGQAWYVNRYVEPAFFSHAEISQELDRLSALFGEQPRLYWMPQGDRGPLSRATRDFWKRKIEELERQNDETRLQLANPLLHIFDSDAADQASEQLAARNREIQRIRQGSGPSTKAVIAVWGQIELQQLSDAERAAVAARKDFDGLLVGYLGDIEQSAQAGLPVYRLAGGAGFLWAASFDETGTGSLRFLASDAGRFPRKP